MMRWDIINALIEKNNYTNYLEIGYYKSWSFDQVKCKYKSAVDPNPCKTIEQEALSKSIEPYSISYNEWLYKETSDNFFKYSVGQNTTYDIIFIDGLHEAEQVYRDIQNSLNHLSPRGAIVMHDCNPPKYEHTTTGIDGCWTGDTYKAVLKFRDETFGTWDFKCVDTDWGVGIIQKEPIQFDSFLTFLQGFPNYENTWEYFDKRRKDLLTLITPEQLKNKYL
jgi:hypothetical protein